MPLKGGLKMEKYGQLLLCCSCLLWPSLTFSAEYPHRYDAAIREAVEKWWPDLPFWRLLKAQYWQESRLDPSARSPVSAEGIAQFMEPTWRDAIRALGWPHMVSRRDANYAIEGGAWYMRRLRSQWRNRVPQDSHDLALGSYNAGTGNVLKAQSLCGGAHLWERVAPCLSGITGEAYAHETTEYVIKVHRWYADMESDPRH